MQTLFNSTATNCDIRDATLQDASVIHDIITEYVPSGLLLPRPVDDIQARIGNFKVIIDQNGTIIACGALRDFGNSLYEIRSLAVKNSLCAKGIGSLLVQKLLRFAVMRANGPARVFALTYRVSFFEHLGFARVDKQIFPEKIWADCSFCPSRNHCGETAVVIEVS